MNFEINCEVQWDEVKDRIDDDNNDDVYMYSTNMHSVMQEAYEVVVRSSKITKWESMSLLEVSNKRAFR